MSWFRKSKPEPEPTRSWFPEEVFGPWADHDPFRCKCNICR